MAKEYEAFKKSFDQIQKSVDSVANELKKNGNFVSQTSGVIKEGTKEVGLRIQELKDKGQTGSSIKDFESDPMVKKMLASIESYMTGLDKELKRIAEVHKGDLKKAVASFKETKKELADEIKTRKKSATTKLGTGNKSLPDMEKLLKEMDKYSDSAIFISLETFTPEDIAQHRKELNYALADEVKQSKDVKLTSEQQMLDEQALNLRNLASNVNEAKKLLKSIQEICKLATEKLLNAQSKDKLMVVKNTIANEQVKLSKLASIGERALKNAWIKSKIQDSKDKDKILAGIKAIAECEALAQKAVKSFVDARSKAKL